MIIFTLVLAGEIIFSLPFHVARFFRPSFLEVFQLTNTELGDVFGLYGLLAMLAYFPGGPLADRFPPKILMSVSLLLTAAGALYLVQIPSLQGLTLLFAYWGVTTIFLFWAAMIKLTRLWGGENSQGKAFAVLDGGRGFVAAGAATIGVVLMGMVAPEVSNGADQQRQSLQAVISFYGIATCAAGLLVLVVIPSENYQDNSEAEQFNESSDKAHDKPLDMPSGKNARSQHTLWEDIGYVLKRPVIWLQGLIVLTAYCGYKGLDYFGLYLTSVFSYTPIESSQFVANVSYVRLGAALVAGVIADKIGIGKTVTSIFVLLLASFLIYLPFGDAETVWIKVNIVTTFLLVFAIRAIYFALLEESQVATSRTGIAVGIISVVGFTPDIFFAPIAGRLLDGAPGVTGFHHLFLLLAVISVIGAVASYRLFVYIKRDRKIRA
ncbi:MFS transporter [Thalassotalea litorea]|uniref:MFS transporter n=1 Tax=Thalassotalea litorea TaxID=2020715 RepID=UPI001484DC97|nr:MFS transporter [Thalassotalea litorea]